MIDLICDYYAKDLEERPVRSQVEVRSSSSIICGCDDTRGQAPNLWCRLGICGTNKHQRRLRLARSWQRSCRTSSPKSCQVRNQLDTDGGMQASYAAQFQTGGYRLAAW